LIQGAKSCGFTLKELRKAFAQTADGSSNIGIGDFVALIKRKIAGIDAEIAMREQTKAMLAGLKESLTADRSAEVAAVLDILKVQP
jgi:DNA-binding transcriptional MerR regulator